ncbi:MAG: flagellar basal body-associated FliL family protein [Pseudomonadota bacterium]
MATTAEPAQVARSTPRVIWILLVVNLATLGAAGIAVATALRTPPAAAAAESPPVEAKPIVTPVSGPRLALETFVVNLDEPGGNRYLKLQITVELQREEARAPFNEDVARVRDGLIAYLSSQRLDDIRGAEGKLRIKEGIQERLSELTPGLVRAVYLTDFVVQ